MRYNTNVFAKFVIYYSSLYTKLCNYSSNTVVKNTFITTIGFVVRTGIQTLYFIFIARGLKPTEYGAFAATLSLVSIAVPFSSWGSGHLLIKHTSRDRNNFPRYWGAALITVFSFGLALSFIVTIVSSVLLPTYIPIGVIIFIALSELIFARVVDLGGQAFQAFERLDRLVQLQVGLATIRLLASLFIIFKLVPASALIWSSFYFISSFLTATYSIFVVHKEIGRGSLSITPIINEFSEGFHFSLSLASQSIYNDIDKTMLSRMSGLTEAGVYTASYRIIDALFSPVRALLYSSYAKYFRVGKNGLRGSLRWAIKLITWSVMYSTISIAALYFSSRFVPLLLGQEYMLVEKIIIWLAPLLLLKSIHYFLADSLTGAGFQSIRSKVQLVIAIINIILNIYLIPLYGVMGAVYSSIATDSLFVLSLTLIIILQLYKQDGL